MADLISSGHVFACGTSLGERNYWVSRPATIPIRQTSINTTPTALAMVAAGLGISIVPELAAKSHCPENVTFRPFAGHGLFRVISLMKRRGQKHTPAASLLLQGLIAQRS